MNLQDRTEIVRIVERLEDVRADLHRTANRHLSHFGTDEGCKTLDVAAGELSDVIHNLTVDLGDTDDLAVTE